MDGKVVVVTGALGALGSVVVDEALALGARIASVDHAPTQVPATADLFELGGVDLTDAVPGQKSDRRRRIAFRQDRCADQRRRRICIRDGGRRRSQDVATDVRAQRHDRAQRIARGDPASRRIGQRADRQYRRDGRAAGQRRHGRLRRLQGRRAPPHRGARRRDTRARSRSTPCCPRSSTPRPTAPACRKPISQNG